MASLDTLSAAQIAAGVAAGDFTATEVARAALDAVEAQPPRASTRTAPPESPCLRSLVCRWPSRTT